MFDLVIRNGTVIDGNRTPRYRADVGICGDRITAVGDLASAQAQQTIDATGKIVAPGAIDVHTHADGWLLKQPHFVSKTTQGVTTEIIMADGISYAPVRQHNVEDWLYYLRPLDGLRLDEYLGWESVRDYLDLLDRHTAQNVAAYVPFANVRVNAIGFRRAPPDDFEMRLMVREMRQELEAGAVGISTGLDYIAQCFSGTDEIVDACVPMAETGGVYVTHVRYKRGVFNGIREAVEIGKRAGVPVHISHLKGGLPADCEKLLHYIDTVARHEVSFTFDVYPYQCGSTMLNYVLPSEVWEDGPLGVLPKLRDPIIRSRVAAGLDAYKASLDQMRIAWVLSRENEHWQGHTLEEYVQHVGLPPADAICQLLIEERMGVLMVVDEGADPLVHPMMRHELCMLGSDGIFAPGVVHPRQFGSVPRWLGPCVREHKLFTLEEAVYKTSGFAASRYGLKDRGRIGGDCFADVMVFDADTIADRATYEDPQQYCTGIEHVLVNGVPVISNGAPVEDLGPELPGRALRFNA
ncbi:MAG TPA: D-aminoacylase [Planctomycetaceae bacterium]|nr:D-aminoacylase [Planctomycetaceae bacterium]